MTRYFALGGALALGIGGYPLVASLTALIGADGSQLPSIVFRFLFLLLVPVALYLNRSRLRFRDAGFLVALAVFWTAYTMRVLHDGYIEQSLIDTLDPARVLIMMLLFVLMPMLLGFVALDERASRTAATMLFAITLTTAALLLAQSQDIIASLAGRENARFSLERLNPITIGYVGGVMLVFSAINAFSGQGASTVIRLVLGAVGGLLGASLIMISASKGPALAAAVALLAFWLVPIRPARLVVGLVFIAIGVAAVLRVQGFILKQFDLDVSTRYVEAAEGEAASVDSRVIAFEAAWQQFKESPLFGDALFDRATNYYPHNLPLEAFMTTGLVGGVAYLVLLGMMLLACLRLLRHGRGYEWLALLAIYFNVAAQTSGSHFGFGQPWLLLVATIVTANGLRSRESGEASSRARRGSRSRKRRRQRTPSVATARAGS